MDHNNILGAVLAGGKSQRFGEDKSQVKLNGKLLIDYILSEIIDEFKEILIVSNKQIKFKNYENISLINDFNIISINLTSGYHRDMQLYKGKIIESIDG